jgi:hypothetical protein
MTFESIDPGAPQPILDPTDPRYGKPQPDSAARREIVAPSYPRQPTRQRGGPGHVYPRRLRRRAARGH